MMRFIKINVKENKPTQVTLDATDHGRLFLVKTPYTWLSANETVVAMRVGNKIIYFTENEVANDTLPLHNGVEFIRYLDEDESISIRGVKNV